jgi:DNA-binding CsgD family transcriptional regulator
LWSNSAASRFIAGFDGVDVVRGVLMVEDHRQHQALSKQLAIAIAHPHCWTLHNEAGERSVVLSIQRLGDQAPLVCGVRFLEQRAPVYAHFRHVYGLTHAEDRVLHQLLSGRVASDIAHADGGSLETVRAHIKAIYAKMQVCSREELFHAAGRFRLA